MKHRVSRELYEYWDNLRAGRSAPERADLDPAAIRGILAETFILAVEPRGSTGEHPVTVRLSGTRLNALFLRELKGSSMLGWWATEELATISAVVDCVLDQRQPVVAGVLAAPARYPLIEMELLVLPLRHHGKTHARVLGSLAPVVPPSWLGLRPVEGLRVSSFRNVAPTCGTREAVRQSPTVTSPSQRGRFRVYEGGRSTQAGASS